MKLYAEKTTVGFMQERTWVLKSQSKRNSWNKNISTKSWAV